MPQSNVYALMGLASFGGALFAAWLWGRLSRGELPGGEILASYLRMLIGFLLTAAIVFGYRALTQ